MKKTDIHQDRGFTLVEMIIVVIIIGILVTVVVGVSKMVVARAASEKTRTYMQTITLAINAYREAAGDYPPEETDIPAVPEEWYPGMRPSEKRQRMWSAFCRNKKLYQQLIAVPLAQKRLAALPEDAVSSIYGENVFVDGFETYMDYFRTGGIGGLPVLISAGADRTFDTEDDIRSDNR